MPQKEPGLLRTSFRFVKQALNENVLLRTSVLATVLCITLACILLAFFGVTYTFGPKSAPRTYSPRLFGLLFLPAEFLLYDLILGNQQPRTTLKDLYLDRRFLQLLWAWCKYLLAVFVPAMAVVLLLGFLTAGFGKIGKPSGAMVVGLILGGLALICAAGYLAMRFLYLTLVVARREPQPLRTAFRETKGKVWRIGCALFLPSLAIAIVSIPMEILGPMLERNLGFVGLAPWFLLDAGLTGFMNCLSAAVLAFSYQRIILSGAAAEAPGAEFALSPVAAPQDASTNGPGGTDSGG